MEQELISIVVPVYRAERYIEETMDCVRAQTYPHWELLLVEDCIGGTVADVDSDGENEVVIRTRWPEKPYSIYDYVDGEIVTIWPDTLPEEILESLVQF